MKRKKNLFMGILTMTQKDTDYCIGNNNNNVHNP